MNQLLGVKVKKLFVVLLFAPLCVVPSVCSAVNACISGTPILNVIAPNPKAPGGNVSYSVKAVGYGFSTYEIRASDRGVLKSGTFSSGQTVSGNYNTPSGAGLITFNIKDAGGNVIPNCYAKADMTIAQDICEANLRGKPCYYNGPSDFHVWANYVLYGRRVPQFWGTPVSYSVCFKCAPPIAHNFQVNSSNLGLVNSGSIVSSQMVVGSYSIAYGTNRESYAFTFPGSGWLTGQFSSWATTAPPCDASFSLSGALTAGSNIQFNAGKANINGSRPDNYKWKVDGKDYMEGNDKNIVSNSFSAGNHTMLLTVDDGLGTSCSKNQPIIIPTLPPPPPPLPCTVNFDVRNSTKSCLTSSCNYNEPLTFSASAFVNPGSINGYTWTMSNAGGGTEKFNGNINTGASVSKTFVPADGKSHNIHLVANDSNGNTCTMDKTLTIKSALPGWNEIAPYLLQLGPIGLLALLFLARIIFLRL